MGNETALASVSNLEGTEVVVTDSVQLNLTAEEWTYHHDEATIAINLTANGSTANLSPGTTRDLNAQVSYTNWHIWTSNWGGYERRYEGSGAANGATVEFSVAEGDGLIGDAAPAIDLNGHASANFTMGSGESRVNLSVSYAGALASASIWLLASSWAIVKREKELAVELESDPNSGTVRATAYLKNWSIATDGQSFRKADEAISPATGAQVFFRIDSGTLGASVASTDQDGRACTSYQISGPTNAHATAIFDGCVSSASISVSTDESPPGSQDEPSSGTDDPSASATPASTDPEGEAVGNTNGCSNENCWCSGSCSCETCDCNVNDDFDGEGVTTKEQVIVYRWMPANSNAPWVPDWLGNLLNTLNSGLGLAPAPVGPVASGAGLALSVGQSLLSEPEMPNLGDPTLASPEPQPVVPAAPDPAEYDNWSSEVVDSYTVDWSPVDPFNGNYRIVGPPEFEVKRTIRPAVIANDGEYFPPGSYEEAVRFITTVNYVVEGSSSLPH
jgi:hypothetical protein